MSALLKIKDEDNQRIEKLRQQLGKETKVDVVREALMLLEEKIEREQKIERYRKAARLSAKSKGHKEVREEISDAYEFPYED
jgi:hypothetical protein